jgi:hypothetical protein
MTTHDAGTPESIRWLLTARDDNAGLGRNALGSRDKVAATLSEFLPRLTMDAVGTGVFKRGSAELTIHLVGDPVRTVELTLDPAHLAVLRPPLERVAEKAGWQLLDPDRHEILFPVPVVVKESWGSGGTLWFAAAVVIMALFAAAARWASSGSNPPGRGIASASGQQAAQPASSAERLTPQMILEAARTGRPLPAAAAGVPGGAGMPGGPGSIDDVLAQARRAAMVMNLQRKLAPQFRGHQAVLEMLLIQQAEAEFQVMADGQFVDPARLAGQPIPAGVEMPPMLPAQFAAPSRGGYRFFFTGRSPRKPLWDVFGQAFDGFVYVAQPEPGNPSPYTFALHSQSWKVHYATNGQIPTESDPAVTDSVAEAAPELIKEIPAEANETGLMSQLRNYINGFFRSKPVQDAQLAFHEDRAIGDLRAMAAAQEAFFAMSARGYASPEVLSDPSRIGQPSMPPTLDKSFTQKVREGYQFTFVGQQPTSGRGDAALYGEYSYTAVPVGDGPAQRRSFALFSDGVIRVRTDGAPPKKTDQMLQ